MKTKYSFVKILQFVLLISCFLNKNKNIISNLKDQQKCKKKIYHELFDFPSKNNNVFSCFGFNDYE